MASIMQRPTCCDLTLFQCPFCDGPPHDHELFQKRKSKVLRCTVPCTCVTACVLRLFRLEPVLGRGLLPAAKPQVIAPHVQH